MSVKLDLHDVQGNITKAYAHYGFLKARYIFYRIQDGDDGRKFVQKILPYVTTAISWDGQGVNGEEPSIPKVTTNLAFTHQGLIHLGVPSQSMQSFPFEFSMGMRARKEILGDNAASSPEYWDPIWQEHPVHIFISLNGFTVEDIEKRYQEICEFVKALKGVEQLRGHKGAEGNDLPYQEASVLYENGFPTPKEHFGYFDGISDPYFEGSGIDPAKVMGGGKRTREPANTKEGWKPLEAGEFVLGHKDEVGEYPPAPIPRLLSQNGSFLVYRKLHENIGSFKAYMKKMGDIYPGGEAELAAKFAGRWQNGAPLTSFPTQEEADQFMAEWAAARQKLASAPEGEKAAAAKHFTQLNLKLTAFDYNDDISGTKCPIGAHMRRLNPRGALEYGKTGAYNTPGALVDRRRIARRGLPYGKVEDTTRDDGDHGIIFMVVNADIKRQFEFCQQQWVNYGNDFKASNDKDPLLGNHDSHKDGTSDGRMVIESEEVPFLCPNIPRFVETKGGDYFFIPSLTALHMIADGIIDPT